MMISGNKLEQEVYDADHIEEILGEIRTNFPRYFASFIDQPVEEIFGEYIEGREKEAEAYAEYLHPETLDEFDEDPNAFKRYTRTSCPIIRRCLMSRDEAMKSYKRSFNEVLGRDLLNTVTNISVFGRQYALKFDGQLHEQNSHYSQLNLEPLNDDAVWQGGVVGYGIQSTFLFARYPHAIALRSQNAIWSLYFLSGMKDFGLQDSSEFIMVKPKEGVCEQNYFYPPELFGFYALKIYLMLKTALAERGIALVDRYRYVYLSAFVNHIANDNRQNINALRRSSEDVESNWN